MACTQTHKHIWKDKLIKVLPGPTNNTFIKAVKEGHEN